MRAESFMAELNNGVKLCRLIGALQSRISQSGASDIGKVSCGERNGRGNRILRKSRRVGRLVRIG